MDYRIKQLVRAPENMYYVFEWEDKLTGENMRTEERVMFIILKEDGSLYYWIQTTENGIEYIEVDYGEKIFFK